MNSETTLSRLFPQPNDIPAEMTALIPVRMDHYLIGGKLEKWQGPFEDVQSAFGRHVNGNISRQNIGRYPVMDKATVLSALAAAKKAYNNGRGVWPTMTVAGRIKHIQEFSYRMAQQKDTIVKILMWEIAKSHAEAVKEFDRTLLYINDTVAVLKDLDRNSSRFVMEQSIVGQIRRAPLGVVLCMGPYNYPFNETVTTLIPALLMGNTAIIKPPKHGVLLFQPLMEALCECFPKGVVNLITGEGKVIVPPLMETGQISILGFIGTSRVANSLRKMHPKPNRLRCVLGTEAKNVAIVLEDADLDVTVRECLSGSLSFNGQRCTALKIIFVHKNLIEPFLDRMSIGISNFKLGMPWDKDVMITPMPEPGKPEYLNELVLDAVKKGSRIVNPNGGRFCENLFCPTLLNPITPDMRIYHEEQFGPVVPVVEFEEIDEPILYVESSDYGQQLSIFGQNPDVIADLIDPLVNQVCRVNLNSQCQRGPDTFPFTGRKDSAEGTLSVSDALRAFSIRTLVAAKENTKNTEIISKIVREHKSNFLSTDFIF